MAKTSVQILSGQVDGLFGTVKAALAASRGQVVLLSGAPGSGKSTTMDRLAGVIGESVPVITRVSADETTRRQPFGMVSAMAGIPAVYPPRPDTADRILVAVEKLCAAGPSVLCGDDLHQADADSLRVLAHLVDATRDLPLVLLLTRRSFPVRERLDAMASHAGVLAAEVLGVDSVGTTDIVRQRCGGAAGPRLLNALQTAGGNPFHIDGMLVDLLRHDRIQVRNGVADVVDTGGRGSSPAVVPSMKDSVRAQLTQLDGSARDLLEILAVWGRSAPVGVVSEISGISTDDLRASIRAALEIEIVGWNADHELAFAHDLYREVLYEDLMPGMRRMLHAACASQLQSSGGRGTEIVQHVGDSITTGVEVTQALETADNDLRFAPEQAADLLAQVQTHPGSHEADTVAVARAGALAAAGRMPDVVQIVRSALAVTKDPQVHNTLTRLLLHSMVSSAATDDAISVIDAELTRPGEPGYHDALIQLRRWTRVLTGEVDLSARATTGVGATAGGTTVVGTAAVGTTGAALVPTAMELFLQARCSSALDTVLEAQRARESTGTPSWGDGATAPVWPGWFALYARGPAAAMQLSLDARRAAQSTGRGWLFPQHLGVAGAIDQFAGRWGDAVTVYQAHWEMATGSGSGWRSRGTGGLLQIHVHRGALDEAAAGLELWRSSADPDQFGVPWVDFAELLLMEARGDAEGARQLAHRIWSPPLDGGRVLWALLAGPDIARIAATSDDRTLLERVAADTAAVPLDEVPVLAAVPTLVTAIASVDPAGARQAAEDLRDQGSAVGELQGWEEAAVSAAASNDRDAARDSAAECLRLAVSLGAHTVERRLAARLRQHGVRLGATGPRRRPATGIPSLTPTELVVAEKVSQGLTSPEIAAELFLSPRTVQTHVSHILQKMQIRSRVELATVFARL